jgi:hydrogenase-4 component E
MHETVSHIIDLLAAAILVTTFLIVSSRSLTFYVRLFSLQSFMLGTVALLVVIGYGETHIVVSAILTLLVKAIGIPIVLNRLINRIKVPKEVDFSVNTTISLIICGFLVILANSVAEPILSSRQDPSAMVTKVLPISISIMLIGLFIMTSRRKAITQIIGLLTMENGVFLSGLSITSGMPMIVELGIFFDILVAALILGVFVFRINRTFETIDIDTLRRLRH